MKPAAGLPGSRACDRPGIVCPSPCQHSEASLPYRDASRPSCRTTIAWSYQSPYIGPTFWIKYARGAPAGVT